MQHAKDWHWWLLLAVLLAGGGFIHAWQRGGEKVPSRQAFSAFPKTIREWRQVGFDERFDAETEAVLRADDYLSRRYVGPDGVPVSFYAGYYASQRNGATYHSPLNCLPGSGWQMSEPQILTVQPLGGGAAVPVNRYVIADGEHREVLLYWYQGRGRTVTSEYWGKIYTVWDSVRARRSDAAMVRVLVPIGNSEERANRAALDFAATLLPHLPAYIPQ